MFLITNRETKKESGGANNTPKHTDIETYIHGEIGINTLYLKSRAKFWSCP
jgi:hypothetical protein